MSGRLQPDRADPPGSATRGAPGEWLTVRQAVALLNVSPATLRRWADAGRVKAFVTPGGHRRFSRTAIVALLPATRARRPGFECLGETTEHLVGQYHRVVSRAVQETGWLAGLDEQHRELWRVSGRKVVAGLLAALDAQSPAEQQASIEQVAAVTASYGRAAARRGGGLTEVVETYLRFRLPFVKELGVVARRGGLDAAETSELFESATSAFDQLLVALLKGYTLEQSARRARGARRHGPSRATAPIVSVGASTP